MTGNANYEEFASSVKPAQGRECAVSSKSLCVGLVGKTSQQNATVCNDDIQRLPHFHSRLLVVSYPVLECTKDHPQVHSRKDLLHALFKPVMINILIVKFIVRDF